MHILVMAIRLNESTLESLKAMKFSLYYIAKLCSEKKQKVAKKRHSTVEPRSGTLGLVVTRLDKLKSNTKIEILKSK